MKYEREVILLGPWKNFAELEEALSLEELLEIYGGIVDKENRHIESMASIYGVELKKQGDATVEDKPSTFQDIVNRAKEARREKGLDSPNKASKFNNYTQI